MYWPCNQSYHQTWKLTVKIYDSGEVGREEGSGWGACDFFFKNKKKKKKKKRKINMIPSLQYDSDYLSIANHK